MSNASVAGWRAGAISDDVADGRYKNNSRFKLRAMHDTGHAAAFMDIPRTQHRGCAASYLIICICLAGGDEDQRRCLFAEPMTAPGVAEEDASAHFGLAMSQTSGVVVIERGMDARSSNDSG